MIFLIKIKYNAISFKYKILFFLKNRILLTIELLFCLPNFKNIYIFFD